ncbi:HAD-IIA family hydrolase [Ruania zhangjianzhongii]|uniref:HAD-IIA family hydrolase n=1 Tax=Ruania zhangjianzhongii TaxID=2603206 RepID=UPI0011C95AB8|nr:HAD-IA family hydrolase [Ruania zhangjianzhongii]
MADPNTLEGCEEPLRVAFDVALLDLDGVVYRGDLAVPFASGALTEAREAGMQMMFVTNNASRTPDTVARHLTDLGAPTGPEEVTTAAQAAARLIAADADDGTRVLPVGGEGLRRALLDEGLTVVESADEGPTVVVQGLDKGLGWYDLAEATYALNAGATYVVSNLDATLPTDRGMAIGNGALVAAVVHATGVQPRSAGKPEPGIFAQAASRAGARNPVVVGDRLNTDLAGARAAGYPGLHVFTGVDGPAEVLRARPEERPTFLGADLRALGEPHPAPDRGEDGSWTCRDAVAEVRGDTVIVRRPDGDVPVDGGEVTLDELRAACAAAWAASDEADVPTVLAANAAPVALASD